MIINQKNEEMYTYAYKQQKLLAIIFLDIDYFKQLNDYYGHL
ncbi:diguanylate cyclase domain-containing protein [Clostridium grantii]